MPMALGWRLGRRVPLMRLEDTLVRPSAAGVTVAASRVTVAVLPGDPLAGAEGTVVVPDLAAAIGEALLESQHPFIEPAAQNHRPVQLQEQLRLDVGLQVRIHLPVFVQDGQVLQLIREIDLLSRHRAYPLLGGDGNDRNRMKASKL